jgi:hypothetical protein
MESRKGVLGLLVGCMEKAVFRLLVRANSRANELIRSLKAATTGPRLSLVFHPEFDRVDHHVLEDTHKAALGFDVHAQRVGVAGVFEDF